MVFAIAEGVLIRCSGLWSCVKEFIKGKLCLYVTFINLEKVYDKTDRAAVWQMLQIYGMGEWLSRVMKSFYRW